MSDAQQESRFTDLLDQHVFLLSDISHHGGEML